MEKIGKLMGLVVMVLLVGFLFNDARKERTFSPFLEQEQVEHFSHGISHSEVSAVIEKVSTDSVVENLLLESDLSFSEVSSNNVDFLKKVFATTSDSQVMNLIIQLMVDEYQFLAAKQFIETLSDTQRTQLDPLLHLQVLFNSFSLSSTTTFSSLSNVLQNYLQLGKITQDQYWRFSGILAIMQRDYNHFFEISRSFSANAYRAFAQKLVNLQEKISQQSDMPAYYFDALVGVELFNQGFFQGAKVLALSVVSQDKAYLLPYQLLAYANFLTASWDAAIEYFHLLSTLNPQSAEKYSFLIGVAYYWNGAYEKSVLQLSQVKGADYLLDTERYLALNYLALQQTDKLLSTWQKLLGSNGLGYADFFSYFYKVFFEPYSKGEEYLLYQGDTRLAQNYLVVCSQTLTGSEKAVCEYGKIGLALVNQSFDGVGTMLLSLIEQYPQGYLYHALGEFYLKQGKSDLAKSALLKAVGMSSSMEEGFRIKSLLQQVM